MSRSLGTAVGLLWALRAQPIFSADATAAEEQPTAPVRDRICLFTDHLDDHAFSYADIAKMLAQLKIAGPDLTVRAGGVVKPERVAEELPKVDAAMRDAGLTIPMVTTNLTSAADPTAKLILQAMKGLGIRYFKLGYYHYENISQWEEELKHRREELAGLLNLARMAGVQAGLHNHAGASVGGALWDGWEMLRSMESSDVGFFFDPAHATIEGAKHAWKLNLQRVSSRVIMVAIKDYVWEKTSRGWQTRWCPLGEGMVNWDEFFQLLSRIPFAGPLSIHIEYDPGGSTPSARFENSLAAAERDVQFVRKHLGKVYPEK